jgi:4-hydroxyphenylpyruvate dioxygenase
MVTSQRPLVSAANPWRIQLNFLHHAHPAVISAQNPMGTDGLEFIEFAHPEPDLLKMVFMRIGYTPVARHRWKNITVYRQGDINFVLNAEPSSFAARFVHNHGPCAPSIAWRVFDAPHAFERALKLGAEPHAGADKALEAPAIVGIDGSLIHFIDGYTATSPYRAEFEWIDHPDPRPKGIGLRYVDHLAYGVKRGNMDTWCDFFTKIFNFHQISSFDIKAKLTRLNTRTLGSPCGRVRLAIAESTGIEEYLQQHKGEGIQHIAIGTDAIYDVTDRLAKNGLEFMPGPSETYYQQSLSRVCGHDEPVARMKQHGILIDGESSKDGDGAKILLQVFSKPLIGPMVFEFIQRKGHDGFGGGNVKALYESLEEDQVQRGVLTAEATHSSPRRRSIDRIEG